MNRAICLLIVLCLLLYTSCLVEGYISNQPPKDRPDDLQYYACHDYASNQNLGNNNYKLKHHGIGEPQQGPYSYFLDEYNLRNYDEIFHAPICEKHYNFKDISSVETPTHILDHSDIIREQQLLKVEEDYDKNSVKDPDYLYGNPNYIGNKLTYSEGINELFLMNHASTVDDKWSERLDPKVVPK